RNYARYLEADVDSVLVLLDNAVGTTRPPRVVVAPGVSAASVSGDAEVPLAAESSGRPWGWFIIILAILVIAAFYAVDRGWVPESWLLLDWLKDIAHNEGHCCAGRLAIGRWRCAKAASTLRHRQLGWQRCPYWGRCSGCGAIHDQYRYG